MPRPEDTFTNYPEDAAAYERWRGICDDSDDRPTPSEYWEEGDR